MLTPFLLAATIAGAAEAPFYAELKVMGKSVSVRRVWRSGANLARREIDDDQDWGGRRVEILQGGITYTLDEPARTAWRTPTGAVDGRTHLPVFDRVDSPALEGLEYGRETDFFRAYGADQADEPSHVRGCGRTWPKELCHYFELKLDEVTVAMTVGADGMPRQITLNDNGGFQSVEYVRYGSHPAPTARFAIPAGYKVMQGTRAKQITGRERGLDQARFVYPETGSNRYIDEQMCRRRAIVFYLFSPSAGLASDQQNLETLHRRYGRGRTCFIPVAMTLPDYGPDPVAARWLDEHHPPYPLYLGSGPAMVPSLQPQSLPAFVIKTNYGFITYPLSEVVMPRTIPGEARGSTALSNDPRDIYARLTAEPETVETENFLKEIQTLMDRADFTSLNAAAWRLRTREERLQNGVWRLSLFYSALTRAALVSETERAKRTNFLNAWIAAYPNSIAPRVALGGIWLAYASLGRGFGWAEDLNGNQARKFTDRLGPADQVLSEARKLVEHDPELYVELLQLAKAKGLPKDQVKSIYRDGAAKFPGYQYLHVEMAKYLDSRWYGELGDSEAMLEEMARENSGGLGDEQYARAALLLYDDLRFAPHGERFFEVSDFSWPRIKKGFVDMEKRYPGSGRNLNYFAFFASLARDRSVARELFERIGDNYAPSVWGNPSYYERWRDWARASPPSNIGPYGTAISFLKYDPRMSYKARKSADRHRTMQRDNARMNDRRNQLMELELRRKKQIQDEMERMNRR